jgi:hypothetical protein
MMRVLKITAVLIGARRPFEPARQGVRDHELSMIREHRPGSHAVIIRDQLAGMITECKPYSLPHTILRDPADVRDRGRSVCSRVGPSRGCS